MRGSSILIRVSRLLAINSRCFFLSSCAIVERPSPIVNSKITEINFHPYWTVPASIIKKDLIPLMQKDPTYLATRARLTEGLRMAGVPEG